MEPTWYNFADFLAEQLPELREQIEKSYLSWVDGCGDPYPHVFLDEFIAPLLLGTGALGDDATRTRAGEILDQILVCSDHDLAEAAITSILEAFRDHAELRQLAWAYLGPVAREWTTRLVAAPL